MTTYATQQDFVDAFGAQEVISLTNLYDPTATTINTAKLVQCQEDAKALIDGMIALCPLVAQQMPFATVPPLLRTYELDICRYRMDSTLAREDVRKRYDDALKQLALIGQCKMALGLAGTSPDAVLPNPDLDASATDAVCYFGDEVLSGY